LEKLTKYSELTKLVYLKIPASSGPVVEQLFSVAS